MIWEQRHERVGARGDLLSQSVCAGASQERVAASGDLPQSMSHLGPSVACLSHVCRMSVA